MGGLGEGGEGQRVGEVEVVPTSPLGSRCDLSLPMLGSESGV